MKLGNLTISGFKSFGERTVISFSPSVTAIIGPNGSGKSNVIDALRWVAGGGRASTYRADSRTELIFHGAAGKRSVSVADVELELKAENGKLAIQRNLFRDGTGTLKLNGASARLMDVEEALVGTGLGRGAVAVIGQGEVGEILMANPDRLLAYASEAAGVAQLGRRREITIGRIDTARSHLLRLDDVMVEMREQVTALKSEADEAAQHELLTREVLQLGFTRAYQRVEGLQANIDSLRGEEQMLGEEIANRREKLRNLGAQLIESRKHQVESETAFREAMAETEARRGDLRVAEERLRREQQSVEGIRIRLAETEAELSRLTIEPPTPPEGNNEILLSEVEYASAAVKTAEQAHISAVDEHEAASKKHDELRETWEAFRQAMDAYEVRRQALEERLGELHRRRSSLGAVPNEESKMILDLKAKQARLELVRAALRDNEGQIAPLRAVLIEAQTEAGALERELSRLKKAARERHGYSEGPKLALTLGLPGVIGAVADLFEVESKYRAALNACLGYRAEQVVVENTDAGLKVLEVIKQRGCRVTLIPLEHRPRVPSEQVSDEKKDLPGQLLRNVVKTEKRFEQLATELIGDTLVVTSLEQALRLSAEQVVASGLVTLKGEWVRSDGTFSGGDLEASEGPVGHQGDEDALVGQLAEANRRAVEATQQLDQLEGDSADLIEEERTVTDTLGNLLSEVAAHEESVRARKREIAHIEELERANRRAFEELNEPAKPTEVESLESGASSLTRSNDQMAACVAKLMQAQEELARQNTLQGLFIERWQSYKTLKARYDNDQQRHNEIVSQIKSLETTLAESLLSQETSAKAVDMARAAIPGNLDQWEARNQEASTAVLEIEENQDDTVAEQAKSGAKLEATRLTLARRETALELARDDLASFPEGLKPITLEEREVRRRLGEGERKLEKFGPVNHRARSEFESRSQRLGELEREREEAINAIDELDSVLARIDNETTTKLNQTLEELRRNFEQHVITLFGKGAISDLRVEREEGRPVGLELVLQPPGKQTKALNLLSVGERTMGALAFLFSLVSQSDASASKGLPVAILDEVDAPLDESNIRRFCSFVERLAAEGTQFVLITHQKATFEVADAIWGVTTQEGVSRVFSIRRDEEVALRG
ncbi:MAG: chromosome segregation protein SMC [Trueperaceae bacterium]|nr:chromosome segregation protein SMC [Trueperaceae bacterium]